MAKISIIGTGTWGIALSILLHQNGHEVSAWSAIQDEITYLRENRMHRSLPGVKIPEEITWIDTDDLRDACMGKDLLVLAVPSIFTRETCRKMKPYIRDGQIIVNVAKGIEEQTLMTLTEQMEEEIPRADAAVLSGPSHAEEVSRGIPTTCVAGAKTRKTAELIQNYFMSPVFRVYTSPDVLGIELGGALKNVIALAAGVADGLGYGANTKAALITRGIAEISRAVRNRRSDCHVRQYAQPQPQGRNFDLPGKIHGGSHAGSQHGRGGCLLGESCFGSWKKIPGISADHRAGESGIV